MLQTTAAFRIAWPIVSWEKLGDMVKVT